MITYVLIAILHVQAGIYSPASDATTTQEFTSKERCEAAGEFLMASHEELYQANSARYTCLPK